MLYTLGDSYAIETCVCGKNPLSTSIREAILGSRFCQSQAFTSLYISCIVCFYDCK